MQATATGEWQRILAPFTDGCAGGLHLAVCAEPYMSFILDGSKTVESRFSSKRIAPHGRVNPGDIVLLKRPGKPVVGFCRAADVWDYELDPDSWSDIKTNFSSALRIQDGFWESRQEARFATLIRVGDVREVGPLPVNKRDRRGWVVLAPSHPRGQLQ